MLRRILELCNFNAKILPLHENVYHEDDLPAETNNETMDTIMLYGNVPAASGTDRNSPK